MAAGSFRLPTSSSTPSGGWQRPSDWLPMPTGITESDQTFVGLHAVIEDSDNYAAFRFTTSAGQYRVDWGDGSTPTLHNSNTIAQYQYNFATVSNSTLTSRGYKQSIITVTPVSGNLLTCDFNLRFVTSPVQNQAYSTGFLDCILSMPNASSGSSIIWSASTANVRHRYVERFDIKTIGGCTTMGTMFNSCSSLQSVPLFNTANVTNMSGMFNNCFSLQSVPLFNTASVTSMSTMFNSCSSLQSVPLFNTASVGGMGSMFQSCSSLQSVPLFNTASVTSMGSMFNSCSSLQSVPLFNTASVTNMSGMFNNCFSLQSVPLFNTASVTDMSTMFFGCSSLQSVPLFNTANVTSMSTMFSSCLSLQSVPLFNTASVTNMSTMFFGCSSLNSIPTFVLSAFTLTSGTSTSFAENANSLNRCQIVFRRSVGFQNCQLSRDAIVEIFNNLADRSATTSQTITISGNWGVSALSAGDLAIATGKNWTVTT